ncbi:MAG: WG repeat-containing protein [Chitinophagaceae bacterium]|nr:WG repeat-containing protein [Chitinophagaceae bacterium]
MLIKPTYEYARQFSEGMAAVMNYGYYGYVNKQGDEVITALYDDAEDFSEGLAAVKGQWEGGFSTFAYINKEDRTVIIPASKTEAIEWAYSFRNGRAVISRGKEKVGMIDKKGNEIIPCMYDEVGEISDSMIAVKMIDKWGYCDINGKLIISCRFEEAHSFYEGEALVKSGDAYYINKKGEFLRAEKDTNENSGETGNEFQQKNFSIDYINTKGERIIKGKPGVITTLFFNGMTPVMSEGKWGFMNKTGALAIPCKYDSVGSFSEGVATVRFNNKWGFIYQDDDTLTSCRFDYAYNFSKGIAVVRMNGKYGYFTKTGDMLIPCRYDNAYTFKDELAIVRMGNQFGFVSKKGDQVIPCSYDDAFDFNEGLAAVQKNGLFGYIDMQENTVVSFQFEEAGSFSGGLALVKKDGLYGYIDKTGKLLIPARYKSASSFNNGTAIVTDTDDETFLIDSKGNELFTATFRTDFMGDLAMVEDGNHKKGFINRQGKMVVPFLYDDAMPFNEGLQRFVLIINGDLSMHGALF